MAYNWHVADDLLEAAVGSQLLEAITEAPSFDVIMPRTVVSSLR